MAVKREISQSILQLEIHEFKRLALSSKKSIEDGRINIMHDTQQIEKNMIGSVQIPSYPPIISILSDAGTDFDGQYERGAEIGRGGFSTVYRCTHRVTGVIYAVKVIDLRPLRLREKFSPERLRREVDIMRRLRHPNIIQFVEVFETADQLMVVMEYAPGKELFDVILAKKHMSEEDAKPLFSQMARALHYLHSLNIIHRDIKPENVLILEDVDPLTGLPVAKLLDFGLSKNANRSVAKTFVGTPCYLAPEVEFTSKGVGGNYGTPADCWSLGAVLYVMLVARFPEFNLDPNTKKPKLKLPQVLWGRVSEEAKSLILALMEADPSNRMTMRDAMQHPWLGRFRQIPDNQEIEGAVYRNNGHNQKYPHSGTTRGGLTSDLTLMMEIEDFQLSSGEEDSPESLPVPAQMSAPVNAVAEHAKRAGGPQTGITVNVPPRDAMNENAVVLVNRIALQSPSSPTALQFAPLLNLQRSVAVCFEEAHSCFLEFPEVAAQVRRGAMLCRDQLYESIKMLRKVEQTAASVTGLLPDLEMAVEEGEPALAAMFFNNVYEWVSELKDLVTETQKTTRASMVEIQNVVDASAMNLSAQNRANTAFQLLENMDSSRGRELVQSLQNLSSGTNGTGNPFSQGQLMELFLNLFGRQSDALGFDQSPENDNATQDSTGSPSQATVVRLDSDSEGVAGTGSKSRVKGVAGSGAMEEAERNDSVASNLTSESESAMDPSYVDGQTISLQTPPPPPPPLPQLLQNGDSSRHLMARSQASARLAEALVKLRQVDMILLQLRRFWSETADVLDMLTREGHVAEEFIKFVHTPRLLSRFKERIAEYKLFWDNVGAMCRNYLSGVREPCNPMYGFLDRNYCRDPTECNLLATTLSP